jgi:ketosteroid isomerase-like protein
MRKLFLWLIIGQATLAFGQNTTPAPATLDADAAITRLREGLVDSFQKGDIDRLISHLDTDVVATWQNGEVSRGHEAVRAYYNKMMTGEDRIVREVKAEPEVLGRHVYGDTAVSWGNLHDHFVLMDGSELPMGTLFTITVARRGDRWLVTGYHASVNAFANPVLKLAVRKTATWAGAGGVLAGLLAGFIVARALRRKSIPTG